MRRMDRYNDENNVRTKRSEKNQELYQNVFNNTRYTHITDVTNANAFDISNHDNDYTSRESYQKMRKYKQTEPIPKVKKELDDFKYLYQKDEKKVYDINSVLEEARKNRKGNDELEEKRKLKNNKYNILINLDPEELKKYREERKNRVMNPEEEEIRELIDTIASKTLAGEIDKATTVDLLSDLMATNVLDRVEKPTEIDKDSEQELEDVPSLEENLSQEQIEEVEKKIDKEEPLVEKESILDKADTDFYTRSMDLSDKDFDMSDDFKDTGIPFIVKLLIFILIIALIAIVAYFIYRRM